MGCIYKFRGKNYTEDEFNNLLSKEFLNQSKTRVLYELQSDLFQKGRDKTELVKRKANYNLLTEEEEIERDELIRKFNQPESDEDIATFSQERLNELNEKLTANKEQVYGSENKFLQLLNKDNQWVTFFLKSIVQDSAKKGYEKVLFPTGDTASKIEGHTTLEEFKHQEEKRLEQLENKKQGLLTKRWFTEEVGGGKEYDFKTQEEALKFISEQDFPEDWANPYEKNLQDIPEHDLHNIDKEIEHTKQNLERVDREGFGALRPIYKFYEETVGNILKKNYKDKINRIADEYGNQWWELNIDRSRDLSDILFQLPSNLPTEVTPEVYNQLVTFAKKLNPDLKIEVLDDLLSRKGANGIAQIKNWTIQLQKGKESAALGEEVAHFFFELLPVDHSLRKSMMSDITLTRMYKMLRSDPDYNRVYEGNTDLLKREAAAKLISLYLSDKELFKHYVGSGQLVDKIIRWIKDFFNWIRGKKIMIGSFVHSAESIMRLDTSQLAIERAAQIQDMYSLADIVKEATILKTVKDLDTKRYDKIYINLSDTIFDVSTYDFKDNKKGTFMDKSMQEERELFYKEVKLTNLGEELKDKIAAGFISPEKIIFFSSMYNEPGLVTRLNEEFGNVQLIRTNIESIVEDDKGRVIKETTLNTLKDVFSEVEGTFAVVDNQRLPKDVNVNFFFQYNNRQTVGYEPMVNRIRNREATEQNIKRIRNLVEELKRLGEESITSKIIGAFKIIRNEVNTIENLEEKLQGIDEDYESIFKNENGDLLLPLEKAKKMKQFVEELDKYEEGLIELVGTLEAVTMFFKDRNDTKFERIKEQIQTSDEKAIDSAIRELNQITKMGKHWQDYIQNFREIIKDKKADLLHDLLGRLDNQITITQNITRELSKQAIGNRLDKELELYNANANAELDEFKKKLSKTEDTKERERLEKRIEEVKKRIKTPEDIINILNGTHKDIDPLTVWIKTLHNSSDPLIGGISKLIQKHGYDVENKTISLAQELGDKVTKIMEKYGVTEQDVEDYLVTTGHTWEYEGEGEDRKLKRKETWNLLFKYKDLDRRFEMMQPYLDAKRKWSKAVEEKKPKEEILELKKDFIKKKNDFESWETTNWNREYTEEYYRRYDEFKQNEEDALLFEQIALIQTSIWNKIEDLTLQANFISDSEGLKLINQQIEDARKELKRLKKEVNIDGTPKTEEEVRMAKMLKRKSEIDQKIYEFQSDQKKFKGDFLKFIAGVQTDSTIKANLVKLVEEDTYENLYNYASTNAPYQVKQWLELNTVNRIDPLWYEERKVITQEISRITNEINRLKGLDQTEDFDKKWKEMFNLTSDLRDENNVFDGSQADPNVQYLVKDIEEDLERLKGIARESDLDTPEMDTLKKQLREWIGKLNQIQSKKVTDAYIDEFIELATNTGFSEAFEMVNSHIVIDANTHPLDVINTLEFQKFIEDNPDHPFSIWYKNNHFLKTTYNAFGEQIQSETPTYIWYKIEPTDPKRVHTVPSMKYSKRVVRDEFKNDKKDLNKYHPVLKWLPKSPEFIDENWMNLQRRDTPKKDGLTQILKLLTDFHLRTQEETNVYEARIGLKLPYVRKQGVEGLKAQFANFFDTRNRFEQGEANFDESVPNEKFKLKGWFNGFVDRLYGNTNDETTPSKFLRVAVPYTHYMDKEEVSKNPLLSIIMFNATTHRADRMLKTVPLFNLIEDALVNPPTVDLKGRIQNSNTNRISALRFAKEHHIYGMNKKYELGEDVGKKVDTALRYIRSANTLGSLGFPFGMLNVLKNNLQGRLQNLIGGRFGNWSTPKSMRKAAANTKINFAYYISQAEKPLSERGLDFQILSYFNPTLDANIYENLIKGSQKRAIHNGHFYLFNNAMEFSISTNLLYSHLYHVKVKNQAGEIKELYEILEFKDGKIQPKQGFKELKSGKEINDQYLLDTKLAYKTVVEYVQGRISTKTMLSTTTIGQAILYFKNWLIPMLRRRFDSKKENYMIGEDLEGYWRTWLRMSLLMTKDMWNDHKTYWNTYTEEERRNFITALQEMAFMAISLAILSLVFGFNADDPDKFKKLKDASYAEKLAVLLMVQAKSETEALSAMPFLNVEKSAVPTVLTEGVKWVTNPTIGLSIIDNTWKTLNALWALMLNQDSAYYNRDMPQYDIEKGDTKAWHYTKKILQFDDFLLQSNPEDKLRIVIGNMKR